MVAFNYDIPSQHERLANGSASASVNAFLSDENQDLLYRSVRSYVYERTGGRVRIGPRPEADVLAVMCRHINDRHSLREMNDAAFLSLKTIVLNNVAGYLSYLNGISESRGDALSFLRPTDTRTYRETPEQHLL